MNNMIHIIEHKIHWYKEFLKKVPIQHLDDDESPSNKARAKMTVKQMESTQIYKRKQINIKDAIKLA